VLSSFLKSEFDKFKIERDKNKDVPDYVIEEKVLGYNHAQIGGFLSIQWKIPHKLGEAITYHHNLQLYEGNDALIYIVNAANYIAKSTFYDASDEYLIGKLDKNVQEFFDMQQEDIELYKELLREEYNKSETFMQMVGIK